MANENHTPLVSNLPRVVPITRNVMQFPVIPETVIQHGGQDRRRKALELLDCLRELCGNNNSVDDAETTIISEAVYRIASVTRKWIQGEIGGAR